MDNSSAILETEVSTQGRDPEEGEDANEQVGISIELWTFEMIYLLLN